MNIFSHKLWRRCAVTAASFLVFFTAGNQLALSQATVINNAFGIVPYEVVKDESAESGDTEYFKSKFSSKDELQKFIDDTEKLVEAEGLVLLKNENNALPLSRGSNVSVFGQTATRFNYSSSGSSSSGDVTYPSFQSALEKSGFHVNQKLMDFYTTGAGKNYYRRQYKLVDQVNEAPWDVYDSDTLASVSSYGDAAIVAFARNGGEGGDVSVVGSDTEDGSYLSLHPNEEKLLKELTKMKGAGTIKKIIVLLNTAYPLELDFLYREGIDVDACMWVGNVGAQGIYSVTDALVGDVVPSGRLSDTYVRDNFSSPAMASWMLNKGNSFSQSYTNAASYSLNQTQQYYAVYTEGLYVGYRYYETRYEDVVTGRDNVGDYNYGETVAYPFGYGISYAQFEYSDFTVEETEKTYEVSVKVTNTSTKYDGKEVVQVYLQKPYTEYDAQNGVEKASIELVGFDKTGVLAKNGGNETVKISVDKEELKSYDSNGYGTYILDAGEYYLTVGKDSHDAVNNILAVKGYKAADGMDSEGNTEMAKMVWNNPALDAETYSTSTETGNPIANQFDFMDVNRYSGSGTNRVTYLTRNNWTGTWPKAAVALSIATPEMAADISSHKALPTDTDATMPTYGVNKGLSLIMLKSTEKNTIDYNNSLWEQLLNQMTFAEQAKLLTDAAYSTSIVASVNKPASNDNDGPMGNIKSELGMVMPSEGILASTFNLEIMEQAGKAFGEDSAYINYSSLYAPGVNIHRVPFGGRATEYYSEDPFLTGMASSQTVKGMQSLGVIPTVKHFAFNNEETNRNGIGIWMNEQEAREIYLKPFEMTFRPSMGNAHGVMTSFNRAGCIWTSACPELMMNVLRNEWNFDGYSLTDMAASNGAAYMTFDDGIFNGTDLFLGSGSETALDDYKGNVAFAQRMREASHRVLYVFANYSRAMNGIASTDKIVTKTPWWEATLIALISVSAVAMAGSVCMLGLSIFKEKRQAEEK